MPYSLLERLPQLRRITNAPAFQRGVTMARQHWLVDDPIRFIVGELRGGTRAHRLAVDPAYSVLLRHRTVDMAVFDEIFRPPSAYEPPSVANDLLRAIAARRPLRVMDVGANVGLFAVYVLSRHPGAHVTSYEPEPANFSVLAKCVARNSGVDWKVIQACATTSDGPCRITPGKFAHAHMSPTGVVVPGMDVLPWLGRFDYVKMDVEGGEWAILRDDRFVDAMRNVAIFVLEWHERGCSASDPRAAALRAVEGAGFHASPSPAGWPHGIIWGWRPGHCC